MPSTFGCAVKETAIGKLQQQQKQLIFGQIMLV